MEIVCERARDVGEGAKRIRFPEPSTAGILELVNEVERLLCLAFERQPRPSRKQGLLGDQDAVGHHEHRHPFDRERCVGIAREKEGGHESDHRVDQRERRRRQGNDRAKEESGRHCDRHKGCIGNPPGAGRDTGNGPKNARQSKITAHQSRNRVRCELEAAPDGHCRARGSIERKRESKRYEGTRKHRATRLRRRFEKEAERKCEMAAEEQPWCVHPVCKSSFAKGEIGTVEVVDDVEQQRLAYGCARGRVEFNCRRFAEQGPTHLRFHQEDRTRAANGGVLRLGG
ncbi:MAG TPA: hypothetical protein VNR86_03135 [Sphingomicrobium sp.]|nr:hypothetical protein [Sphingomicrobium sp.]